jgi:uncharacterized membrane protein
MTSRWIWLLTQVTRRIWFRAALFSVAAVATALVAILVAPYIPSDLPTQIGADAVDNILGIIASSMLSVTTFSLSTMVSAYSAATSNVTPRATTLVMEDTTTQNVLATFVGSFLFSLVGIIALSTGAYGDRGRVVLFAVTIVVVGLIVVTLLRWIDHLSRLGRVTETTERVEKATTDAMRRRIESPYLGGAPLKNRLRDIPDRARPVRAGSIGYVQHVDAAALSDIAEAEKGDIYLAAIPGDFIDPSEALAYVTGFDEDRDDAIRNCFSTGDTRSFDQDPRFGACVLTEIASRALSPGINDPGTAIDVIGRAVRVLAVWIEPKDEAETAILFPRLHVPGIAIGDLFDDFFTPIARDGAGIVEVQLRLQKAFRSLARLGDDRYEGNAARHARQALQRAELGLSLEEEKQRVRDIAADVEAASSASAETPVFWPTRPTPL